MKLLTWDIRRDKLTLVQTKSINILKISDFENSNQSISHISVHVVLHYVQTNGFSLKILPETHQIACNRLFMIA